MRLMALPTIILGLLAAGTAAAQAPTPADPPPAPPGRERAGLITTHAEAHRRLPNTVSDASVSIEVHGRDLRGTATQLGRQAQSLLGFLRTQPVERLRTDGTSFETETQEVRNGPDRIKGYAGTIGISFRTTPDQLPFVLAGCLDNGATSLGQFGSSPREDEAEAARRDMVGEAARAAAAQARAIADAVGQRIAGVDSVEVDPPPGIDAGLPNQDGTSARAAMAARPVPPLPTQAGDSDLSVTVVMTLRVAPPG